MRHYLRLARPALPRTDARRGARLLATLRREAPHRPLGNLQINRLQFHLTDDEGWRIEIPGLPELTDVGSRRGMTEKNPASSSSRMPATETPTTCRPHQTDIFPKTILWNFYAMPMHAEWK